MTGTASDSAASLIRAMAEALVARFGAGAADVARQQAALAEGAIAETWTEILAIIERA